MLRLFTFDMVKYSLFVKNHIFYCKSQNSSYLTLLKVMGNNLHITAVRNLTKVWKTKTGPLQGDRVWSGGLKSALFEIPQTREHSYYTYLVV